MALWGWARALLAGATAGNGAAKAETARVARMVKKVVFIFGSGGCAGLCGLVLRGLEVESDKGVSC